MSVDIIWCADNGGEALTEAQDLGLGGEGSGNGSPVTVFIRHTGLRSITNCKLYIAPFSGSYEGEQNPQDDYDDLISEKIGTLQINIDSGSGFPTSSWLDISTAASRGISPDTGISIADIDSSIAPGNKIQLRFVFPDSTLGNVGSYYFDLRLVYTYTS